jgi:transcriptional regulator with XRE-family HTH domain
MEEKPQHDLYIAVGKRVREVRRNASFTQEQLASQLGISRPSVSNIEKGRQQILVHTLYAIAEALGVNVRDLLPESNQGAKKRSRESIPSGLSRNEWKHIQPLVSSVRKRRRKSPNTKKGRRI